MIAHPQLPIPNKEASTILLLQKNGKSMYGDANIFVTLRGLLSKDMEFSPELKVWRKKKDINLPKCIEIRCYDMVFSQNI